jgi:L-threonylcarbamoyladenylate synthase
MDRAAMILRNGGLVAFPTETVYGLGADAFNPSALAKVFEVKGRPRFDPLIIHIADTGTLDKVADLSLLDAEKREKLFLLAENLWPGPLSLILPKRDSVPGIATGGLSTLAVRFPDHPVAQKLISLSTGAVAAPSANPFGYLSPTRAQHVRDLLGNKIDIILDGGPSRIGVESTVLDLTGTIIRVLRPGGTPKEAIEKLIGPIESLLPEDSHGAEVKEALVSPGMLKSHYAPKTVFSVYTREEIIGCKPQAGSAFLFFDSACKDAWIAAHQSSSVREKPVIRVLSDSGDLLEAAASLFNTLHELDNSPEISRIVAQLAPETGLGAAINDRLRRAAAGSETL